MQVIIITRESIDGTVRREYGIELKTLIHTINETKIEEIINEFIENKKEKEVVVEIKKIIDKYIKKWKCHQISGYFRRWFDSKGVDKTTTVKAWKSINIKKNAVLQLTKMQDGAIFCLYKKAKIMKNERMKYCPLCKYKIATVEHILLSCIYHKKSQIEKHDNIGIIIWEGLIRKYTGNNQYKKPPYETVFQYKDITMIWNKQIMPKSDGQYHKRPDIYVLDKKNKTGLLFDMTIVADHNIN
ncbi:hypothetical protein ENUP19_0046G0003 [Entamoeba nuttalli]|uniref:Reverse transcriptase zinc-binding domain-containing protein n=1 Tax=Entamoeba nuttalli TaxID=412467 RepID=A0ABQ0DAI4_9EUKA